MKPTIFVDLDGTLIWTWPPLITSAFMSQIYGLPICTPPKRKDGYLKLTKVPIGATGAYSLTCRRPNIGRFLASLRALGDVCLLTHASRNYALAINSVFNLGFTEDCIFSFTADYQTIVNRYCIPQKLTILIDDEGPGWHRRWRGQGDSIPYYENNAGVRHREKCHCIGIKERSRRDIAYPRFAGRLSDAFCNTKLRRSIIRRVAIVLRHYKRKGLK